MDRSARAARGQPRERRGAALHDGCGLAGRLLCFSQLWRFFNHSGILLLSEVEDMALFAEQTQ
jgi:hypothetical protein